MDDIFLGPDRLEREQRRGIWPNKVVSDYLDRWLADRPEQTAIVSYRQEDGTSTRLSWRQLGAMVSRIAAELTARGIRFKVQFLTQGSQIDRDRSELANQFLETDFNRLFWIDSA